MKRVAEVVETTELCCYGCSLIAHYRNGSGKLMCEDRHNKCPANKLKNSIGLKRLYDNGRDAKEIYAKLPEETKDKMAHNRNKFYAKFEFNGKGQHKKVLINERGHMCEKCKNTIWEGIPITLELEHVDADRHNNTKDNLLLLCPNCHSQTPTWKVGNGTRGFKVQKYSDSEIIDAVIRSSNINQVLEKLNLRWGSASTIIKVMVDNRVYFN